MKTIQIILENANIVEAIIGQFEHCADENKITITIYPKPDKYGAINNFDTIKLEDILSIKLIN